MKQVYTKLGNLASLSWSCHLYSFFEFGGNIGPIKSQFIYLQALLRSLAGAADLDRMSRNEKAMCQSFNLTRVLRTQFQSFSRQSWGMVFQVALVTRLTGRTIRKVKFGKDFIHCFRVDLRSLRGLCRLIKS